MDIEIYVIKYGNSYVVNNKLNGRNNSDTDKCPEGTPEEYDELIALIEAKELVMEEI